MKYECDLIRDLMPLCADGAASDASKKAVRTHTEACTECAKVWADYQMGLDLKADASVPQEMGYAKAAKKFRKTFLFALLGIFFMTLTGCWFLFDYLDTQPLWRTHRTRAAAVKGWVEELTGHRTALFLPEYDILAELPAAEDTEKYYHWLYLPEKDTFGVIGTDRNGKGLYCIWCTCGPIGLDSESMIDSALPIIDDSNNLILIRTKDLRVQAFRITFRENVQSAVVSEHGCAAFVLSDLSDSEKENPPLSGEALDKDGNVLYTMTVTNEVRNGFRAFRWTKHS